MNRGRMFALEERDDRGIEALDVADHERQARRAGPAATRSRASATDAASGFSTRQAMPRSRSAEATAWCASVGVATTAARIVGRKPGEVREARRSAARTRRPWPPPGRSRRPPRARTPGISDRTRAWILPRWPAPTTATSSSPCCLHPPLRARPNVPRSTRFRNAISSPTSGVIGTVLRRSRRGSSPSGACCGR